MCGVYITGFMSQTARWSMLLLGVLYGSSHFSSLQKKENKFRAEEAIQGPIRQKQLDAEKAMATRGNLTAIRCIFLTEMLLLLYKIYMQM